MSSKKSPKVIEAPLTHKPTSADRYRVARQAAWDAAIEEMGMRTVCRILIDWAAHRAKIQYPLASELPAEVHRMARPRTQLKPLPFVDECFWAVMYAWIIHTPRTPYYPNMNSLYSSDFSGIWSDYADGYQVGFRGRSWEHLEACGEWTVNNTGDRHNRRLIAAGVTIELIAFEKIGRRSLPQTHGYYYPKAALAAIEKLDRDYEDLQAARKNKREHSAPLAA